MTKHMLPDNVTITRRIDLAGKPWQIDVQTHKALRSYLIDSADEMNAILQRPSPRLLD